jgi:predicted membrane channel-forming protein YqfA (hemolysin III family)
MGSPASAYVVGVYGLDGDGECDGSIDICGESKSNTIVLFACSLLIRMSSQIPERWMPYRFDIWGASHQTFHVAVMIAAWIHFRGLVHAFQIIRSVPETC